MRQRFATFFWAMDLLRREGTFREANATIHQIKKTKTPRITEELDTR
jgi:hypothetical protein